LQDRRFARPRSIAVYENAFDQLLKNLPGGVRFIDQLATPRALNSYVEFLRGQGYSNKTLSNRMGFVFSLLKANGVIRWRSRLRIRQSESLLGLEWDEAEIKEVTR
jgi:hypothetical protein